MIMQYRVHYVTFAQTQGLYLQIRTYEVDFSCEHATDNPMRWGCALYNTNRYPDLCIGSDGEAPFSIVGTGDAAGVGFFRVSGKL